MGWCLLDTDLTLFWRLFRPVGGSPPDSTSKHRQRIISRIGGQGLPFDFYSTVTELNPEPALVVPFAKGKRGKGKCGKHRRSRGTARDGADAAQDLRARERGAVADRGKS